MDSELAKEWHVGRVPVKVGGVAEENGQPWYLLRFAGI